MIYAKLGTVGLFIIPFLHYTDVIMTTMASQINMPILQWIWRYVSYGLLRLYNEFLDGLMWNV